MAADPDTMESHAAKNKRESLRKDDLVERDIEEDYQYRNRCYFSWRLDRHEYFHRLDEDWMGPMWQKPRKPAGQVIQP